MCWKKLPYWLKGGIIGVIISIILLILNSFMGRFVLLKDSSGRIYDKYSPYIPWNNLIIYCIILIIILVLVGFVISKIKYKCKKKNAKKR